MKLGIEIETVLPESLDRHVFATLLAERGGFRVEPYWFLSADGSGAGRYMLSKGFCLLDASGRAVCKLVDDFTIDRDVGVALEDEFWYAVYSDDKRILSLVEAFCDPAGRFQDAFEYRSDLTEFHIRAIERSGSCFLVDRANRVLAVAQPDRQSRRRVCEVVSAVIHDDPFAYLDWILGALRDHHAYFPSAAAIHMHFDGHALQSSRRISCLVRFLTRCREVLIKALNPNPGMKRCSPWPEEFVKVVSGHDFAGLSWEKAVDVLRSFSLSKGYEFNLRNLYSENAEKITVEVRVIPLTWCPHRLCFWSRFFAALFAQIDASLCDELDEIESTSIEFKDIVALLGVQHESVPVSSRI